MSKEQNLLSNSRDRERNTVQVVVHPDGGSEIAIAVANSEILESISPLAPPESIRVHQSDNTISGLNEKVTVTRLQQLESASINKSIAKIISEGEVSVFSDAHFDRIRLEFEMEHEARPKRFQACSRSAVERLFKTQNCSEEGNHVGRPSANTKSLTKRKSRAKINQRNDDPVATYQLKPSKQQLVQGAQLLKNHKLAVQEKAGKLSTLRSNLVAKADAFLNSTVVKKFMEMEVCFDRNEHQAAMVLFLKAKAMISPGGLYEHYTTDVSCNRVAIALQMMRKHLATICVTEEWAQNYLVVTAGGIKEFADIAPATSSSKRGASGGDLNAKRFSMKRDNIGNLKGGTRGLRKSMMKTQNAINVNISNLVCKLDECHDRKSAKFASHKMSADAAKLNTLTLSNDALTALNQEISTKEVELEILYRRRLLAISTVTVDPPTEILGQVSSADASNETLRQISQTASTSVPLVVSNASSTTILPLNIAGSDRTPGASSRLLTGTRFFGLAVSGDGQVVPFSVNNSDAAYESMMKACKGNMQTTVYESPYKQATATQKMTLTDKHKLHRRTTSSDVAITKAATQESNSDSDDSESHQSEEDLNDEYEEDYGYDDEECEDEDEDNDEYSQSG